MTKINTYRTTARVIGIIYIGGMVIGIGGNILIQSILGNSDYHSAIFSNSMKLALGAMIWLIARGFKSAPGSLTSVKTDINKGLYKHNQK